MKVTLEKFFDGSDAFQEGVTTVSWLDKRPLVDPVGLIRG
jgi:hypothetical protein